MLKKILVSMVGIIALVVAITRAAQSAPQSWGEAVNGMQMSISQDEKAQEQDGAMHLIVELRNIGKEDITVSPGQEYVCGGLSAQTRNITLNLVDSQGTLHHFPFIGNRHPSPMHLRPDSGICAGNLILSVVPLRSGTSLSIPLDLDDYLWPLSEFSGHNVRQTFHAGLYSLQADLTARTNEPPASKGTDHTYPEWAGTVTSNTIQVRIDVEFANDYSR
jgi:hypothetical protein